MDRWRRSQGLEDGEDTRMLVGYSMQSHGVSLTFLRNLGEVISRNILHITQRTCGKVVKCAWVIASLRLNWGNFRSLWILVMLMVVWRRWKWSKVNGWNIHHHGTGPIRWGPSGVDVFGKYTLGYGNYCMLNEVWRQVIECAYVMGPCQQTLS